MDQAKNRELTLLVTASILLAFVAADYYTPAALQKPADWPTAFFFGVCIAQATLVAAWAVFAPGNIVVRLPWSILLGLMMWYVLAFGERQAAGIRFNASNVLVLGLVLLLAVTVLQVPLWIAKRVFRYRMLMPGEAPAPAQPGPMQFHLAHLMLGTFLLSVALAPIRLVLPKGSVGSLMPDRELLVLIPAAIVVNLVATLPCLWGGFVSARRVWSLGVAWSVYSFVVTQAEYAVFFMILGDPHNPRVFWEIYLMNFTQGAVVFAVMRIYRTLGYRLQRLPPAVPGSC